MNFLWYPNVVVCNPRRNALLKEGSRNDRIDARKLAELSLFIVRLLARLLPKT
jgi:hypothetical protein